MPGLGGASLEIVGLTGDRVRLVPPERALHLENALRWMNDPEVTKTLEFHYGVSRKAEDAFFDRIEADRRDLIAWAILDETGRHIGMIDLRISWTHRLAAGGLVLGDRDAWGKGYSNRRRPRPHPLRLRRTGPSSRRGPHHLPGHATRLFQVPDTALEGTWREKIWRGGAWRDAGFYAILESDYAKTAATSRFSPGSTAETSVSPMPKSPETR